MTYQIIITEETSANIIIDNNTTNVSITTNEYPITIEYNAVITQAGGNTTYGDSNVRTFLASGTNTGNIITTSNVSGVYILGNGSQLTGLPATYGNANVAANLAAFANNPISTSGNITAGYFLGDGSQLTGLPVQPGTYGNANVVANIAALGSNPISTTGNITAGYFAGNGSLLTNITAGNITGTVANATYALNANAATYATNAVQAAVANVANSVAGANVSGTVANATYALNANASTFATQATFAGTANAVAGANVSGTVANATYALNSNAATFAGTVTTAAQPNITSVGIQTAINTSGNISATGNITGSYFLGNGSQLTGLPVQPGTYGNANVAANLAAFATNPISTSGNITAGYFLGNGSQLTGIGSTYGNANVAANLAAFANNPISTTGNITAGNVIAPDVYTSNITGAAGQTVTITAEGTGDIHLDADSIRIGDNNTAATIVTHGTGNLILRTHEGDASQGNITLVNGVNGNIQLNPNGTGQVTAGTISASGNITAAYVVGNGSALTNLTGGNVTGTVANATYALTSNAATYASVATFADTANAVAGANVSGTVANATFATTSGSATTATTANTVVNAAQANITSVGILTSLSVSGNVDAGNLRTAGQVSATGNITGANLVATANLTSTQQTVIGTANVGTTGNIVVSGRNMATDMAFAPDGATGTNLYIGRVMVGTGWAGNNAVGLGSRLAAMDMMNRGNTATQVRQLESEVLVNLTANVSNTTFRQQAIGGRIRVGGGSAANVTALTSAFGAPFSMAAAQNNLDIGNVTPYFLGNTVVGHAALNSGAITLNGGSSIGNAYGYVPAVTSGGSGASNITNYIGIASSFTGANVTGNLFCFYNGNATSLGAYAIQTGNTARAAANYYFLRNDDDVAQVKLGSLRSYNEFQYATATSGTVNIDKTNAQVQFIAPTANVTIGDFQNFVTTANDGTNNDTQSDTVTLIIQQGATPYTVTMPTGNASIKYAGGVSTIGATANAVTMVSISAIRSAANATMYLASVSSEFS